MFANSMDKNITPPMILARGNAHEAHSASGVGHAVMPVDGCEQRADTEQDDVRQLHRMNRIESLIRRSHKNIVI
jgi:hypothetical protein